MLRCAVCTLETPAPAVRCDCCGEPLRGCTAAADTESDDGADDAIDAITRSDKLEMQPRPGDATPTSLTLELCMRDHLPDETIAAWRLRPLLQVRLVFDSQRSFEKRQLDRAVVCSRNTAGDVAVDAVKDGCLVAQQIQQLVLNLWTSAKLDEQHPAEQTRQMLTERIPTLHEHCALCDVKHAFPGMLNPSVCSRALCQHQLDAFGKRIIGAMDCATHAEVLDLLVATTAMAATSHRRKDIFTPFPRISDPRAPDTLLLDPNNPDYEQAESILRSMPGFDADTSKRDKKPSSSYKQRLAAAHHLGPSMFEWILSSNQAHIVSLPVNTRLPSVGTPHQFVMMTAPPERQRAFDELAKKHGTKFAWHGSSIENWHAILRTGLKNCSGTKLMTAGAAMGSGIYMARHYSISMSYSARGLVYGSSSAQSASSSTVSAAASTAPLAVRQVATEVAGGDQPPPSALSRAREEAIAERREAKRKRREEQLQRTGTAQKVGNLFLAGNDLCLLALCEVAMGPTLRTYEESRVYVAPDANCVVTRFLFAFPQRGNVSKMPLDTNDPAFESEVRACLAALREAHGQAK